MQLHPLLNDPEAVFVLRTPVSERPSLEEYRSAAHQALAAMRFALDGEKIAIKPNVTVGESFADPDSGIGTHPGFVWGLVDYARAHGARRTGLYVVEDPRNTNDDEPRTWAKTGYPEMAAATGAKLRCPNTFSCVRCPVPRPLNSSVRMVSRLVVDPNTVVINVPKLKTHNLAITTLCMKNLMGIDHVLERHYCSQATLELPQERVFTHLPRAEWMDEELHELWQEGLARRLIDLAQVVQPRLNVVEGIVGRDGTGFQHGTNYALGLVVAGINMVAVDSVASYLVGFDPHKLIYLRMAAGHGLGCNDMARLRIYTPQEDDLRLCEDPAALRVERPFRVIRNIRGENVAQPA